MRIRAVIFDVYGTLLEVGPAPPEAEANWHELWTRTLQTAPRFTRLEFAIRCNHVVARFHEAARALGIQWPEVDWPRVVVEVVPELKRVTAEQLDDFVFQQMRTGHTTRMPPEAAECLHQLKRAKYLLGIASNSQAYTLREFGAALAGHALHLNFFEPELCIWSFQHGFSKPDPYIFQVMSTRLQARGIGPGETLMVGDRLDNDIQPARKFGWRAWHLTSKEHAGDGAWAQLSAALAR
jgi:FMN phosphatase YigB (HAD superfamily)